MRPLTILLMLLLAFPAFPLHASDDPLPGVAPVRPASNGISPREESRILDNRAIVRSGGIPPGQEGDRVENMVLDAVICRPLGVVATVVGLALFIVSSPFSVMGGNSGDSLDTLVGIPYDFTFDRPLGAPGCTIPAIDPATRRAAFPVN